MNDHQPQQLQSPGSSYLVYGLGILFLFVPLIYFGSSRGATEPKDFLAEIILFGLLITQIIKKHPLPQLRSLQDRFVGFFFLFYLGSAILSENYYWSLWGVNKWLALLILYFLAQKIDQNQQDKLITVLLTSGSIVGGFAILNYYGMHFDEAIQTLNCRSAMISTFGNQNYLCAFLAPLIPLNIYRILSNPEKKQPFLYLSFSLILSTLLFAKTRGALLALVISVFTLLLLTLIYQEREWLKTRGRQIATLGGITLVLLVLFSGTPPFSDHCNESLSQRFGSESVLDGESSNARYMLWGLTADMIKDHPLKGIGIGNYGFVMPDYQKNFLERQENWQYRRLAGWALDAHNQYLQVAAEGGLVPAGLLLTLLIYLAIRFFKVAARSRDNLQAICLLCSLATISIHALVSFPLSLMSSAVLFWFIAGRTNLALHPNIASAAEILIKPPPKSLRLVMLVILILLSTTTLIKFASDRFLGVGNLLEIRKDPISAEKHYRTSLKINPLGWRNAERLSAVLSQQGRHQEATKFLERSRHNALSNLADNEEGLNFVRQGQYARALQAFERGRSYFPSDFYLNQNSGLAAKALADPLFYTGAPQRATKLSKLAFLYLEYALPRASTDQDRQKINYYLIALCNNLFNQPADVREVPLQTEAIFYFAPPSAPRRHIVEEITSRKSTRVRLFCSAPNIQDAQLPADAFEINSIHLGDARLYQYKIIR